MSKNIRKDYDAACKKVLANKHILAWILQGCTEEFKDYSIDEIAERYIEGTPEVASVPVNNAINISGMPNEDKSEQEGTVFYDIRFQAQAPILTGAVCLIVNVEAQNKFSSGYPLVKRGIYYCSRMLSSQHGTVFMKSHYEKLHKVYSIWVCPHPSVNWRNSVTTYSVGEQHLLGEASELRANYDLLAVVIIGLGKKRKKDAVTLPLLDMLRTIFVNRESEKESRAKLLDYGINFSDAEGEELSKMCNLSEGVYEEGCRDKTREFAEAMLRNNEPISKIQLYTKLTAKKIQEIAAQMGVAVVM